MNWIIQQVSVSNSKVHLKEVGSGIERVISVPDVRDALIVGDCLFIRAANHLWEVNPADGFRKRVSMSNASREIVEMFSVRQ